MIDDSLDYKGAWGNPQFLAALYIGSMAYLSLSVSAGTPPGAGYFRHGGEVSIYA